MKKTNKLDVGDVVAEHVADGWAEQRVNDDDDDCNGKVISMKLEYTGDGCAALTNLQGGKAACTGDSGGLEPVSIQVTDNRGEKVYGDEPVVLVRTRTWP